MRDKLPTVAVMQPYFVPYAGYFRLFAAADVVVMFDCVQFPRRGWVHRNRFPLASGDLDWLTLPVAKAPFNARIADLAFPLGAEGQLAKSMQRFPLLSDARRLKDETVARVLGIGSNSVADYLVDLLAFFTSKLHLETQIVRSSSLDIASDLRGEARVLAIAERLGAKRYVNPPGGRELYNPEAFKKRGIELCFLAPFAGNSASILARVLGERWETVTNEIVAQTVLVS